MNWSVIILETITKYSLKKQSQWVQFIKMNINWNLQNMF